METWRSVKGYKGLYEVSSEGRIRSTRRGGTSGVIRKVKVSASGYSIVHLSKSNKSEHKLVHRLVAEAFLPKPKVKRQVNHDDGDKGNNAVVNLHWSSPSLNRQHACRVLGKGVFEKNPASKLKWAQVRAIRKRGESIPAMAERYGVSAKTVKDILYGKTWVKR